MFEFAAATTCIAQIAIADEIVQANPNVNLRMSFPSETTFRTRGQAVGGKPLGAGLYRLRLGGQAICVQLDPFARPC